MPSVIISAFNEQNVIERCINTILSDALPNEFEIVVVPNGCVDETAKRAAGVSPNVTVSAIATPSKTAAMNHADSIATRFPRFYVDADVEVTGSALRAVAAELNSGHTLLASPGLNINTNGCSWIVKSYVSFWMALPSIQHDCVGRGVYGMSEAGRTRFAQFPSIVADDHFVRMLFTRSERQSVSAVHSTVHAPKNAGNLIRRVRRSLAGLEQYNELFEKTNTESDVTSGGWKSVLRDQPKLAPFFPVYAGITGFAKLMAKRNSGKTVDWTRDESTRKLQKP
jgi:glycosyltransferase involved in cell wall biosynthesis